MNFYKNKWFWGLVFFVVLSVSWNAYSSFAKSKDTDSEKLKSSVQQASQEVQSNMLPDTKLSMNEDLQSFSSSQDIKNPKSINGNQGNSDIEDKLNKVKTLQELQKKKDFMLVIAQDDLEHYVWREESQFPDIWKQAFVKYNLYGDQVMISLQYDLDTYLTYGKSDYDLVWAASDYIHESYKTGKLKANMTDQEFQKFEDNLNSVYRRAGTIYASREYTVDPYSKLKQAPY